MRRGELDEERLEARLLDRGLMSRGLLRRLGDRITRAGTCIRSASSSGSASTPRPRSACSRSPPARRRTTSRSSRSSRCRSSSRPGCRCMDTADGAFMAHAYGWAFSSPVRKVYYNLTVTTLSVTVALGIGLIELLQVVARSRLARLQHARLRDRRPLRPHLGGLGGHLEDAADRGALGIPRQPRPRMRENRGGQCSAGAAYSFSACRARGDRPRCTRRGQDGPGFAALPRRHPRPHGRLAAAPVRAARRRRPARAGHGPDDEPPPGARAARARRAARTRTSAASRADRRSCPRRRRPARRAAPRTIIVTLPPKCDTPVANDKRYYVVVLGGGFHGLLVSKTTRIPGLVSIVDIAPTALGHQRGSLTSTPAPHAIATLKTLNAQIHANNRLKLAALIVLACFALLLAAVRPRAALDAPSPPRCSRASRSARRT